MAAWARLRRYCEGDPTALDLTLLTLVTAVAGALRLAWLGAIPYGVHSDEAQVGTDVHRILHGDFIGVYTHAALGQPSGHAYLTTPSIWLLGDSAFSLRLPLALVGLAAIPLLYLLVRVSFRRTEAFFASAMLAVSYWHLFYSRVAHWSISYGTVVLAVLLCVMLGMRSRRRRWFAAAGALLGLGAYTYNIYPIAVVAVLAFLAIMTLTRYRTELRWWTGCMLWMGGAALVVAAPMLNYLADPDAYVWKHIDNYSEVNVMRSHEFHNAAAWGKVGLLADQARTFARAYTTTSHPDSVDGNGLRPMFDPLTLVLLALGAIMAVRMRHEPMVIAALCCVLIIPLPAIPQTQSIMRQPLGAAPFAMFIAALPLAAAWRAATTMRRWPGAASMAVVLAALAMIAGITVHDYFWTWRKDEWPRLIYFSPMTSASIYMRDLPPDTLIYFYSDRATINLETRQFLAPDVRGIDRSSEFSPYEGSIDNPNRRQPVVYVLLGEYLSLLPEIKRRFPGGRERVATLDGNIEFYAYELQPLAEDTPIAAP
jgi:4-amino-4-deoxy-L-arabinose transferase-like glycosyltransferase